MSILCKLFGHLPTLGRSQLVLEGQVSDFGHVLISMACSRCRKPIILGHLKRPKEWTALPATEYTVQGVALDENGRLRLARELHDAADALLGDDFQHVSGGMRVQRFGHSFSLMGALKFNGTAPKVEHVINDTPAPAPFESGGGGSYAGAGASGSWSDDSSSCSSSDSSSSSSDCSSSSSSD